MAAAPGGAGADPGTVAGPEAGQEPAPVCSGALALRRATLLLTSARQADAQGERQQACDLYAELLDVQRGLARAPLGSIGKSLRDVAASVELRLQRLRLELGEGDSTTCSSGSRPPTNRSQPPAGPHGSHSGAAPGRGPGPTQEGRAAPASCWSPRLEGLVGGEPVGQAVARPCWDSAPVSECPFSAREGYTAQSARPSTQDGSRRHIRTAEGQRRQPLDGVRPSTRDDKRMQQLISGSRHAAPEHDAAAQRHQARDAPRPSTRDGHSERRGQDVSIRKVAGRRRRPPPAADAAGSEGAPTGRGAEAGGAFPDADESVELLE